MAEQNQIEGEKLLAYVREQIYKSLLEFKNRPCTESADEILRKIPSNSPLNYINDYFILHSSGLSKDD